MTFAQAAMSARSWPTAYLTALTRTEGGRGHVLDAPPPPSGAEPGPRRVPRHVITRRRAANRRSRASRKANRQ